MNKRFIEEKSILTKYFGRTKEEIRLIEVNWNY